ncbi:esterase-like activity of phytase family protein [Actinocatenispora rupis]|uniref:esterase-like activity of phytase family protein n=1 Tax=Actinocatenispora rupis TaxID=519421 RepID=UPI0031EE6C25
MSSGGVRAALVRRKPGTDQDVGGSRPSRRRYEVRRTVTAVAAAVLAVGVAGTTWAAPQHGYTVRPGGALSVPATGGQVVGHSDPAHGTVSVGDDGRLGYRPDPGFTGTDTFTYTSSDAVRLYRSDLPPLATIGGVRISAEGYGSALAPVPGHRDEYYGLTDRGPNVDGPDGTKIEPLPGFAPSIGRFRLAHGTATLVRTITLRAADGTPYNGQVNTQASTGETITGLDGKPLPASPYGYDPEGLVAAKDGTFWVSDEYGPFVTHFAADGRQLGRLSPYDGTLPGELRHREPNKGMEGLTVTPDGRTLVGVMQSALHQDDLTEKVKNVALVRIVTYDLRSGATHEYPYLLHDPGDNGTAVSEITALSATRFLVDERDGNMEPGAFKRLYAVDVRHATDIGPAARVPGATYDPDRGLVVAGGTLERLVGRADTADARTILAGAHVTAAGSDLALDLAKLVTGLDPRGYFFGHDKVEGVAVRGHTLVISNDSDFGLDGVSTDSAPFRLHAKTLPDGTQDDGEYLAVDLSDVDGSVAPTRTTTVTVHVR